MTPRATLSNSLLVPSSVETSVFPIGAGSPETVSTLSPAERLTNGTISLTNYLSALLPNGSTHDSSNVLDLAWVSSLILRTGVSILQTSMLGPIPTPS